jgi:hypothetical protein
MPFTKSSAGRKTTPDTISCLPFQKLVNEKYQDLSLDEKRHIKTCPRCSSLVAILKSNPDHPDNPQPK